MLQIVKYFTINRHCEAATQPRQSSRTAWLDCRGALLLAMTVGVFILPSLSIAQNAPDQVPAFMRAEAGQAPQAQGTQPLSMQAGASSAPVAAPMAPPASSEPAFLQAERQEQQQQQQQYQQQLQQIQAPQNQYQYQSANPDDASTGGIMPPANYQPAPGDVPAFIQQEKQPARIAEPAPEADIKTNKKDDVIQINFSDDQYKPQQDEVTPLNSDQAKQYNTQMQQAAPADKNAIPDAAGNGELKEGAVYVPKAEQARSDEKSLSKNAVPEPEKSGTNMLRINFNKDNTELSDADKKALLPAVVTLKQNNSQKILIKSFTSNRDNGSDTRRIGLMRVINIRDYLMKQGIDFSRTEVNIVGPELNKEDLDYIDIDKI